MTDTVRPPDQRPAVPVAMGTASTIRELPRRPIRKPFGPLAFLVSSVFIAAAAFYAGVRVEKHHVPAASTTSFPAASRSGATSTTVAGRGVGTASGVQGTITLIDGTTLYVTQAGGTVTKVQTSAQSQITMTVSNTVPVGNLRIGDSVAVTGTPGANGIVQATAVRDLGATGTARTPTTSSTRTTTASNGAGSGGAFGPGAPPGG